MVVETAKRGPSHEPSPKAEPQAATDLERILLSVGIVSLYSAVVSVFRELWGLNLQDLLSILIVPIARAGVGYLFTGWQKNRDLAVEEQRLTNAQEFEQQRAQDEVFQAYLDQLAEPLTMAEGEVCSYCETRVLLSL
jgi:hypothetical protein